MNALLNKTMITAVLTAVAAILTATGILPHEVSNAHIAEAATLILALAATYFHGHSQGAASAAPASTDSAPSA